VRAVDRPKEKVMRKLALFLATLISLLSVTPASATDNAWITSPSLGSISMTGGGVTGSGSAYSFSTQATEGVVHFTGNQSQAGKFAQVNFFDFTGGVGLELESGTAGVSSTACDHQTLGGNSHTCFFKLDDNAKAAFRITFSNASSAGHFKLKVLAGPNITESSDALISFIQPMNKIVAVYKNVRGIAGGPGVVQFKVTDQGRVSAGVKVKLTSTGIGENLSTHLALSDSHGLVTVYLTNLKFWRGSATVKASVVGGTARASATIWWFKVKYL
jgi:hypothetical protein